MKKLVSLIVVILLIITALALPADAISVRYKYGDVTKDNSIDVIDATQIQRYLTALSEMSGLECALADFDNDGEVSVLDATAIQMYNVGLISNPHGDIKFLNLYVEIEDIDIKSAYGTPLLENKAVVFDVLFDEVYNLSDDLHRKIEYVYTITGITDETFYVQHEDSGYPSISCSFKKAGVYEIKVDIKKQSTKDKYSFTKRFEVFPAYEFDGKRFVDYANGQSYVQYQYPEAPKDTTAIDYKVEVDSRAMDLDAGYGASSVSEHFVALVNSKKEYDSLFETNNNKFDDDFFKTRSLVVAVSPGFDHYDYSSIVNINTKDSELYVKVVYGNCNPDPNTAAPTAPTWYSFVSVDKADVLGITTVQRVSK